MVCSDGMPKCENTGFVAMLMFAVVLRHSSRDPARRLMILSSFAL